jgi:hypothetical protein
MAQRVVKRFIELFELLKLDLVAAVWPPHAGPVRACRAA